jgi:rhamnogalacturonan endolyase
MQHILLAVGKPLVFACCLLFAAPALANLPGGGNGTGANVTLVNNGDGTVTLANGVVTAKIKIATAQILQYTYNGFQVTDGGSDVNNGFYWQGSSGSADVLTTIVNPSTNGGNFAMIQLYDSYTNSGAGADAYRYFALFRGSPGVYASEVMVHSTNMPAGGVDIPSLTGKLGSDIFNWLAQDTGRNQLMPRGSDATIGGINDSPKEVALLIEGQLAGRFDCKYNYSGDLGSLGFSGWCSTNQTTNFGLWMIHPSNEYFTDGPKHREILAQMIIVQATFTGVHYGFHPDMSLATNENWSKVAGPFFLYFNKVASGTTNPQTLLYSDAAAQTAAERGAWPYSWFTDTNYMPASGRGGITGKMVIADSGNANASAANLWIGVAQQPASTDTTPVQDFQLWGKNYQYWTHTDANGNFSIFNVLAGTNYTLFAFGPGAIGQFQSQTNVPPPGVTNVMPPVSLNLPSQQFSVTVTAGATTNLGNVTWTPTRVGATVWELGVPDRDTTEFRHGDDYWHGDMGNATNWAVNWMPWQNFNSDFPNGVNYTVGQSHWGKDWDYAHGSDRDPVTGNYGTSTWTVSFNLPNAPTNGASASIYFGIAASYAGPVIVKVNGTDVSGNNGNGFFPPYNDSVTADQAMIRMGSHGIFGDKRINFSGSLLSNGVNKVTLTMRNGGYFSNMTMYDYVRLELAGYVPPAPANLTASAGNGLVSLFWPSAPGATGYNVLRSTTSGSGYTAIATNVLGPICGSVDDTAAYADTSAVNGTTYYYVVRSFNPNGGSNSVQVSASPSASTPSAPLTPTNLIATAGNNQVALKWNASSGAARYVIQRTVLTIGAATTYTAGGINPYSVINSFVTGTNYTDTALANNVVYSYQVSAANANGQSVASLAVNATTTPPIPATPTGLTASTISNQVTISWSLMPNASSYIVSRAAALAGPYTIVDNPESLTSFIDGGLNYNTTYFYLVAAASLGGISSNSVSVAATTTPPPPAPVTAIPGNAQIYVDWGDSAGATNYVLQRATVNGGPYTTVISTTNTYYSDITVNNGTTYYFVVYAIGSNGTSPLSVQTTATPSAIPQMIKSDTTNMNTASDWSGVAPVIDKVGLFNNIISVANASALVLGGDVSLDGLIFTNNMNGPVSIAAGNTLTLNDNGIDMGRANQSVTFNNAIALAAAQVWNITNSRSVTLNGGFISSSNSVVKTGGGTLALGTTSNDSGANVQVNAGTVQANTSSGIKISLNGGVFNINVADSNPINVLAGGGTEQNVGGNRTWSGALSGSGPLTVVSASIHTWAGNNSAYSGTMIVQGAGTLRLSSVNSVSATTTYNFNSGNMSANASGIFNLGSLAGTGTINGGAGQNYSIGALNANTDFGGIFSGATMIIKTGTGMQTLSGANNYTGGTVVSNGVLQIGNGGIAGILGAGNVTNFATLAFNRSDAIDDTGFGVISGNGNLAKRGTGRLASTKAHTYTGTTTVEAGTLALTNSGAIASSSGIVISSGALFDVSGTSSGTMSLTSGKILSGSGSVKGGFTIGSGAILAPGGSIGTLTFSNTLTLLVGCTNYFEIGKSPTINDVARVFGALTNGGVLIVTNISGNLLVAGDSFKLFNAASYSGYFSTYVLPPLTNTLAWDTSTVNTNGTLKVIAAVPPVINSFALLGNGSLRLNFSGTANQAYEIRASTNLALIPMTNWTVLGSGVFNGGPVVFDDLQATNFGQRFYLINIP